MSKGIMLFAALSVVTVLGACANNQAEEFVVVEPEPISTEPVYTGKYK